MLFRHIQPALSLDQRLLNKLGPKTDCHFKFQLIIWFLTINIHRFYEENLSSLVTQDFHKTEQLARWQVQKQEKYIITQY